MLTITGCRAFSGVSIKLDEYVPVTFKCSSESVAIPLYWRTGDFDRSLIEVGINPDTGAISKVVLTGCDRISRTEFIEGFAGVPCKEGIPVCDVSNWPADRFSDEVGFLSVQIGDTFVHIKLTEDGSTNCIYTSEQASFGVGGHGELLWIQFDNLPSEEVNSSFPLNN